MKDKDIKSSGEIMAVPAVLELKDVICMPEPGKRVLNGISLRVERRETLRIVGRAGSGKTMLAKLLCGVRPPESGKVFLFGQDLYRLSDRNRQELLRGRISVLGRENGFLAELDMTDNITLPLLWQDREHRMKRREMRAAALNAMEVFEAENAAVRKPGKLSNEELCRMQLARAYLLRPELILADSFTAGLSQDGEKRMWQLLRGIQNEFGAALIHFTDAAGGCGAVERTAFLSDGQWLTGDPGPYGGCPRGDGGIGI